MQEVWLPVNGYEDLYKVSNLGHVYNIRKRQNLKQTPQRRGYLYVTLRKNGKQEHFRVHRLIAAHFLPRQIFHEQVNHIDGDKTNNRSDNLEWCTNAENMAHARKGKEWAKRKVLTNEDRTKIHAIYAEAPHMTLVEIGRLFDIDDDRVRYVLKRNPYPRATQ